MAKGGYKIIDLGWANFTDSGMTRNVPGIYNQIESSNGKPVMLTGIVRRASEWIPQFVPVIPSGSNFILNIGYGSTGALTYLQVDSSDNVTWVSIEDGASPQSDPTGEDGPSASM